MQNQINIEQTKIQNDTNQKLYEIEKDEIGKINNNILPTEANTTELINKAMLELSRLDLQKFSHDYTLYIYSTMSYK